MMKATILFVMFTQLAVAGEFTQSQFIHQCMMCGLGGFFGLIVSASQYRGAWKIQAFAGLLQELSGSMALSMGGGVVATEFVAARFGQSADDKWFVAVGMAIAIFGLVVVKALIPLAPAAALRVLNIERAEMPKPPDSEITSK